jgi:hypothetical protein
MATGKILGILVNADGSPSTEGKLIQDGTEMVFHFVDLNFPNTGLKVNDPCMFELVPDPSDPSGTSSIATNLKVYIPVAPKNITGPFTGDITANVGDVYTISGASAIVTGNILINGGTVFVEQSAQVIGNGHQIGNQGTFVARKGGNINGNIGMSTGGNLKVVNKGNLNGNIAVNQAGRIIIGNNNGPGFVTGTLDVTGGLTAMHITPDSKLIS